MKLLYTLLVFLLATLNAQFLGKIRCSIEILIGVIATPHFDIYYYGDQKDLAEFAAEVVKSHTNRSPTFTLGLEAEFHHGL